MNDDNSRMITYFILCALFIGLIIGFILTKQLSPTKENIEDDFMCDVLCKSKGYESGFMVDGECFAGECGCFGNGSFDYGFWQGINELRNGNITIGGKIDADIV